MDFEKLIDSIENLLYMIIVEITLVVITIGKLFKRSKNCYAIVEAEEAIENREERYRKYSSPIKLGVLLALATLIMINTSNDLDEMEYNESTANTESVDSVQQSENINNDIAYANDSTGIDATKETGTSSDSLTSSNNLEDTDTDMDDGEYRAYNLIEKTLEALTKLPIYEQASILFVVCNLNAIVIGLLLYRIRREPIPGKVFRDSFLSMVYARTYLTFPFLLLIAVTMLSPASAYEDNAPDLSVYTVGALFAFLFFIFGFYKYIRGALYAIKSILGKSSFLMMMGFFIILILLDYWWISVVISLF